MSKTIAFGNNVFWSGRHATVDTVLDYLKKHVTEHPDFKPIFERDKINIAMGTWYFDRVPLQGLLLMQQLLEQLTIELPSAINNWREESRPIFYSDLKHLKAKLAERIGQLEQST